MIVGIVVLVAARGARRLLAAPARRADAEGRKEVRRRGARARKDPRGKGRRDARRAHPGAPGESRPLRARFPLDLAVRDRVAHAAARCRPRRAAGIRSLPGLRPERPAGGQASVGAVGPGAVRAARVADEGRACAAPARSGSWSRERSETSTTSSSTSAWTSRRSRRRAKASRPKVAALQGGDRGSAEEVRRASGAGRRADRPEREGQGHAGRRRRRGEDDSRRGRRALLPAQPPRLLREAGRLPLAALGVRFGPSRGNPTPRVASSRPSSERS